LEAKRTLKAGMIGVGDISMMHRPAYVDNPNAKLVALCDTDERQLSARMKAWGVPWGTTDYRQLLASQEIDLVEVLVPHHVHKEIVVAAARAGKHVSVQKPMCVRISEADEMIEACREAGVKFKVFENFVFYPPHVLAKELLDAGEIGEPLTIRFKLGTGLFGMQRHYSLIVELWHLLEVEKGMGQAVFDDGYHKLSLAVHFIGEVDRVQSFLDRSFAYVDMPGVISWRYKNSPCLGYMDLAFQPNLYIESKYFPPDERVEITGTQGRLIMTRCTAKLLDTAPLIMIKDGKRYLFDDLRADWMDSFVDSGKHFVDCILQDTEPLLTGERGRHLLQFAYAAIRAAKTGEERRPDDITDEP